VRTRGADKASVNRAARPPKKADTPQYAAAPELPSGPPSPPSRHPSLTAAAVPPREPSSQRRVRPRQHHHRCRHSATRASSRVRTSIPAAAISLPDPREPATASGPAPGSLLPLPLPLSRLSRCLSPWASSRVRACASVAAAAAISLGSLPKVIGRARASASVTAAAAAMSLVSLLEPLGQQQGPGRRQHRCCSAAAIPFVSFVVI
jgi:hypothetical protein